MVASAALALAAVAAAQVVAGVATARAVAVAPSAADKKKGLHEPFFNAFQVGSPYFSGASSYVIDSASTAAPQAIFSMDAGWLNFGKRRRDDNTSSISLRAPSINF